jgi:hypothetical protein
MVQPIPVGAILREVEDLGDAGGRLDNTLRFRRGYKQTGQALEKLWDWGDHASDDQRRQLVADMRAVGPEHRLFVGVQSPAQKAGMWSQITPREEIGVDPLSWTLLH